MNDRQMNSNADGIAVERNELDVWDLIRRRARWVVYAGLVGAILGGVYAATLMVFVNDESEGQAETRAFLTRRIEGIMRFEKAKARFTSGPDLMFSPARFLGRLRYPAR